MPEIKENELFTVMVEFEVEPKYQQTLIDEITKQVDRYFTHFSGFVSASFHASDDGFRVVNYGQWQSKSAWEGRSRETDFNIVKEKISEIIIRCEAKTAKVDSFRVARVIEKA
ncbi:antibiotic biosynthesis monooxygenase [Alteribacillus sp. HJP-4]|uniref:antibiotic biosynthesis monooxygenase n=1 Tax=Alteribacillus sp. HJP-4 TaxID=2775394 RepID=UPI0035CCFEB2